MMKFLASYFVFEIVIVAIALSCTAWYSYKRRRVKKWSAPLGFVSTEERFVDPSTGIEHIVWYNPDTGERRYEMRKS